MKVNSLLAKDIHNWYKEYLMITVTGSLAFDYIMDYPGVFAEHIMPDKIHQLNLSFLVNTLNKQRGGTAGNIAYNLALLKLPVSILGTVGDDFSPYAKFLIDAGVDTSTIKVIPHESTSSAFITTDEKDNQIAAFYPGAMTEVQNLKISSIPTQPKFVVISPTTPEAMTNFALECQQLKIPYMFDPGMTLPRITDEQLRIGIAGAHILIGNDYEMALIKERLKQTDKELLKQVEILITTLGENGSNIKTKTENIDIKPAKPTEVLDPTGAGDAYRAGFLAGFKNGFELKVCGQMGSIASCYTVEKYGTTSHRFTVQEFCDRYKQSFPSEEGKENFGEELKLQD